MFWFWENWWTPLSLQNGCLHIEQAVATLWEQPWLSLQCPVDQTGTLLSSNKTGHSRHINFGWTQGRRIARGPGGVCGTWSVEGCLGERGRSHGGGQAPFLCCAGPSTGPPDPRSVLVGCHLLPQCLHSVQGVWWAIGRAPPHLCPSTSPALWRRACCPLAPSFLHPWLNPPII